MKDAGVEERLMPWPSQRVVVNADANIPTMYGSKESIDDLATLGLRKHVCQRLV